MDKALKMWGLFLALLICGRCDAQILDQILSPPPVSSPVDISVAASGIGAASACGTPTVTLSGGGTGDLVVCAVGGADTSSAVSDGTASFTPLTPATLGISVRLYYLLSATGPGKTYSASTGCGGPVRLQCVDVHAAAGKLWHYETSTQSASSASTTVDTGAIATTHGDEFVWFAPWVNYPGNVTCVSSSNPLIGGVTPLQASWSPLNVTADFPCFTPPNAYQYGAYLLLSSPMSGDGTLTLGSSIGWVAAIGAWYAQ